MRSWLVRLRVRIWRRCGSIRSLLSPNPLKSPGSTAVGAPDKLFVQLFLAGRGRLASKAMGFIIPATSISQALPGLPTGDRACLKPGRWAPVFFLPFSSPRRRRGADTSRWTPAGSSISRGPRANAQNQGDKIITNEREISGHCGDKCFQNGSRNLLGVFSKGTWRQLPVPWQSGSRCRAGSTLDTCQSHPTPAREGDVGWSPWHRGNVPAMNTILFSLVPVPLPFSRPLQSPTNKWVTAA